MNSTSPRALNSANSGTESASQNRNMIRYFDPVLAVARALWPAKTARNLAAETQVSERAAEFWLAGKHDMSLVAARQLLRSEHGFQFLVALVGDDCGALWFKRVRLAHEVGVTNRAIRAQEKRVEKLREQRRQLEMFND